MSNANFSDPPPPPGLPPLHYLVRAEQIPKLPNVPEDKKATYIQGVSALWEQIRNRAPDSPEYVHAYKKLNDVSEMLKRNMRATQTGSRPGSQGQPGPDGRPGTQQSNQMPTMPTAQPREQQFSQKVLDKVRQQTFITPPDVVSQGAHHVQAWQQKSKQSYAVFLQKFETSQIKLQELGILQQNKEGKTITQQDAQQLNTFKSTYERMNQEARDYLTRFAAQQNSLRALQAKAGNAGASGVETANTQPPLAPATEHSASGLEPQASHASTTAHTVSDHQGQPHTVSSALDAARSHPSSGGRPETTTGNGGQASQGPVNQATSAQVPSGQAAAEHSQSHQTVNAPSSVAPQYQSPHNVNSDTNTSHGPHPLSHQAAITQSAQKYSSQHTYQNPAPQPNSHAHPQMSGRDPPNSNHKMPIPKDLKVSQPQPVAMGPARPTLTGGPSNGAMGPMGQPAIQKHPGYVLEGDGERVLGRKKLEELVRQVTGGVDGEEGETLTAAAEEVSSTDSLCPYF